MPDPDSAEMIMSQESPEVYCHSCKLRMQQIGPSTFKCSKCGLVHERKE